MKLWKCSRRVSRLFQPTSNYVDTKTFWKTIRLLNHDYSSIPTLLDGDGSTTVDSESSSAKAACMNNFFYTCFNHNFPTLTDAAQDLDFTYRSLCKSLPCSASLYRGVVLEVLAGLVVSIYRQCWNPSKDVETYIPQHCSIIMWVVQPLNLYWHVSHFMETGKNYPNSQRHKQVTSLRLQTNVCPPCCKQTHVKATIEKFLQVNAPISSIQWGFMSNRSTVSAPIRVWMTGNVLWIKYT